MLIYVVGVAVAWACFAGLGWYVAVEKGRPEAEGVILGLLFGPIGALIVALLPPGDGPPSPRRVGRTPPRADEADEVPLDVAGIIGAAEEDDRGIVKL